MRTICLDAVRHLLDRMVDRMPVEVDLVGKKW
jgi:hypothetical protein